MLHSVTDVEDGVRPGGCRRRSIGTSGGGIPQITKTSVGGGSFLVRSVKPRQTVDVPSRSNDNYRRPLVTQSVQEIDYGGGVSICTDKPTGSEVPNWPWLARGLVLLTTRRPRSRAARLGSGGQCNPKTSTTRVDGA